MYYAITNNLDMCKISNAEEVEDLISKKNDNPHWHISIKDTGRLLVNPCTPLFIYGEKLVNAIFKDEEIIFNDFNPASEFLRRK